MPSLLDASDDESGSVLVSLVLVTSLLLWVVEGSVIDVDGSSVTDIDVDVDVEGSLVESAESLAVALLDDSSPKHAVDSTQRIEIDSVRISLPRA
jgi:hypothetical protein